LSTTESGATGRPSASRILYPLAFVVFLAGGIGIALLVENISERKHEAKSVVFQLVQITEETIDPAEWGKNFPRQFDSYKRTVDIERTRHGGSDAFQKLDEFPLWRQIFAGYAFGVDYREERGHAYMLADQDMTERVTQFKQPGACLHCHSSVLPAYREAGRRAGIPDDPNRRDEQIMKGFEIVCAMPYAEARPMVSHPVSCVDCHDPDSMQLRVTRPGFLNGIRALARSDDPLPHLPSVERWRREGRRGEYDPNEMASRQEMRTFVCAQCHVEYYFRGEGRLLTYPWHRGLKAEQMEAYYDEVGFKDWSHALTGAAVLKAQHPEFELWSQGIHARSGVSCADCHMPYIREGAVKISDHHVRSPLLNVARSCQVCHRYGEDEIRARAEAIQDRTRSLMARAEQALVDLIVQLQSAAKSGRSEASLQPAREFQRKAQWRLDFVSAENSMGFHAPQESARLLGESIDHARKGLMALAQPPATNSP
jgi:nitrite reductase (cytochrome c-552)